MGRTSGNTTSSQKFSDLCVDLLLFHITPLYTGGRHMVYLPSTSGNTKITHSLQNFVRFLHLFFDTNSKVKLPYLYLKNTLTLF